MPFGFWTRMGPRNRVLDGGPEVLRDVAMATNFGTQFAITGFVGCNFGCMIPTRCLSLGMGFRGQAIRWRHRQFRGSKGRFHGHHFLAFWRIRLNRPYVAAMRPYVKLLWPFVIIIILFFCYYYYFILFLFFSPSSVYVPRAKNKKLLFFIIIIINHNMLL